MIDIQVHIPAGNPRITASPEFVHSLQAFDFDRDRFVEGFKLAGVPEPAINSLAINLESHKIPYALGTTYDKEQHLLHVKIGAKAGAKPPSQVAEKGAWPTGDKMSLESQINFLLAWHGRNIADTTLRHPDTLVRARYDPRDYYSRARNGFLAMTGGAITGAQVAESTGAAPAWVGGVFGSVAGALTVAVPAVVLDGSSKFETISNKNITARNALTKRATQFANSKAAYDIFGSVIKIELLGQAPGQKSEPKVNTNSRHPRIETYNT